VVSQNYVIRPSAGGVGKEFYSMKFIHSRKRIQYEDVRSVHGDEVEEFPESVDGRKGQREFDR